jgi:ABC-type multidrug transport system ATPase subunit
MIPAHHAYQSNGLSQAQRKLLNVAVELVANPSILFVDEPTSGLSVIAAATVRPRSDELSRLKAF